MSWLKMLVLAYRGQRNYGKNKPQTVTAVELDGYIVLTGGAYDLHMSLGNGGLRQ